MSRALHVAPIPNHEGHILALDAGECWCGPQTDSVNGTLIVVHNSLRDMATAGNLALLRARARPAKQADQLVRSSISTEMV